MTRTTHRALSHHPEEQYLDLLVDLLDAPQRQTRNDTASRSLFGRQMRFDLADGFPLLTTKKLPFRVIAAELLWFLSGSTSARPLQEQGITIWDEWVDENGDLGPVYGKQWRSWSVAREVGPNVTIDQVTRTLIQLRRNPNSRRHIITAWNPSDVDDMALPPCHCLYQFYVGADERLHLSMYQRSADAFLGLPFNIASYALLLSLFAHVLRRQPGEFVWFGGDVHLYSNHITQAAEQVQRTPRDFPVVMLSGDHTDLDHWSLEHMHLLGYNPWPHITGEVSA